jgi:type IV pilus assembly protein PilO
VQPSPIIERLAKLPRGQRFALFGLVYVLVCMVFMFTMYYPAASELEDMESSRQNLENQKVQVQKRVSDKEGFDKKLEGLTKDLKNALKELPNNREIPGLLKGISTLGKKVGLEIRRFTPLPEERREYVAAVPVELEVEGTFHEVAMFFDNLSKMNRIVYVQDIEMGTPVERGGKVSLTVSGRAVTFRFLTDEEIKKGKKGKKGKGKRGRKGSRGGKNKGGR